MDAVQKSRIDLRITNGSELALGAASPEWSGPEGVPPLESPLSGDFCSPKLSLVSTTLDSKKNLLLEGGERCATPRKTGPERVSMGFYSLPPSEELKTRPRRP